MIEQRISPAFIHKLDPDEVFVFGSNRQGVHGKGAAKQAVKWGARRNIGSGLMGQTYAIPTRDYHGANRFTTMPLEEIRAYVAEFIHLAKNMYPDKYFLVTEIGTGNAGYSHEQIAPLFKNALGVENILLPQRFVDILKIQL